jgi:SAM-dependent methyltransferase
MSRSTRTSPPDIARGGGAAGPEPSIGELRTLGLWEAIATGKRKRTQALSADGRRELLDVGCGVGDDVRAMAASVGTGGRVVGVDSSAALIAEARARTPAERDNVRFEVARGDDMPFGDAAFDGARIERVLHHVDDPGAVLAEIRRVVRPGGLVVAAEPDWGLFALDASPTAARAVVAACEQRIRHPWMGRELRRRCLEADLDVRALHVEPAIVTDDEVLLALEGVDPAQNPFEELLGPRRAQALIADLRARSAAGRCFAATCIVVAVAVVPG